jgi:hypothetical protein
MWLPAHGHSRRQQIPRQRQLDASDFEAGFAAFAGLNYEQAVGPRWSV